MLLAPLAYNKGLLVTSNPVKGQGNEGGLIIISFQVKVAGSVIPGTILGARNLYQDVYDEYLGKLVRWILYGTRLVPLP